PRPRHRLPGRTRHAPAPRPAAGIPDRLLVSVPVAGIGARLRDLARRADAPAGRFVPSDPAGSADPPGPADPARLVAGPVGQPALPCMARVGRAVLQKRITEASIREP